MSLFNTQIKKKIERLEKMSNQLTRRIQFLINRRGDNFSEGIRWSVHKIKDSLVREKLSRIDVDEVNHAKEGIRVGLLKDVGYGTVEDLHYVSRKKLMKVNGIGPEMASKIKRNTDEIVEKEIECIPFSINPENPSIFENMLVKWIFFYLHSKDEIEALKELKKFEKTMMKSTLSEIKSQAGALRWFFMSARKKKQIERMVDEYSDFLQDEVFVRANGIFDALKEIQQAATPSVYWKHFEENAATYYGFCEKYGNEKPVEEKTDVVRAEITGEINYDVEFVKEIHSIELHTKQMKSYLRNYQEFGVKYMLHQKRVLLGDEMGLGKTIQSIAAMAHLKEEGKSRFLVVCPMGVSISWQRELEKHSHMKSVVIHGKDKEEELEEWIRDQKVGITTYEMLSKLNFHEYDIDMLVVDEAHNFKNPTAKRTQALGLILKKSEYVVFLTGTPLENRIREMKFLIGSLNEEVGQMFGTDDSYISPGEFHQMIAGVYLRRVREDVLKELPELIELEDWLFMNEAEYAKYVETLKEENLMSIRRLSWNAPPGKSSKAERLLDICNEAKEDGRKLLIFTYFRENIEIVSSILYDRCVGCITGDIKREERQRIIDDFSKAPAGACIVSQIEAGGVGLNIQAASVVIFCEPQFKNTIEDQAVGRAYRMGQVRSVVVHRLLMRESIEEYMMARLDLKKQLFETYAQGSWITAKDAELTEAKFMLKAIEEERKRIGHGDVSFGPVLCQGDTLI